MAGRTRSARSPHRPGLTSRPVTCRWVAARASALTRATSGSRGSGGRTSRQKGSRGTLGRSIRIRLTVCHLLGRSLRGRADGEPARLGGPVLRDGTSTPPGWASPESAHVGGSSAADHGSPRPPSWFEGIAVDAHWAAANIAVTRFKISTSSRSLRFSRRSSASSRRSALVSRPSLRVPASRPAWPAHAGAAV